ncbi:MAG: putative secreted protein [Firmicutes bacterium]|nr:putative secreted protein [Bacillota bacterium]
MKKFRAIAALLLTCLLIAGAFTACGAKTEETNTTNTQASNQADAATNTDTTAPAAETPALSGTLLMSGSTSMEKLANVAAESFMAKYPDVTVQAEFIGSSAGIEALLAGTAQIGNASRSLKDTETSQGAVENIVAIDGIAAITDLTNKATNLTKDQLKKIYTGEIVNWSEVGGADQPIVVVGRESGSGTRGAFEELLEIVDLCKYSNEINSTGGVMAKVASTPGAIGYVSLDVLDDSVHAFTLEGVAPTAENIKAGSYFLSRPFVMATKGEIADQSELVQKFFEYIKSEEGKQMIESAGLINVD